MFYEFSLDKEYANQSFYAKVNGHTLFFRFSTFRDITYADIEMDRVQIVGGMRVTQDRYLIPQRYEDEIGGNIFFSTTGDRYPIYHDFDGVKTILLFDGDIAEIENA